MKRKPWYKQLFCKHSFVKAKKVQPFECLSGQTIYLVCEHCGKIKDSYFVKYD